MDSAATTSRENQMRNLKIRFIVWAETAGLAFVLWIPAGHADLFGQAAGQTARPVGFAAVAGQKGGQDFTGPYEVVPDWPKPLSQLKDHEKWTFGAVQGIFA